MQEKIIIRDYADKLKTTAITLMSVGFAVALIALLIVTEGFHYWHYFAHSGNLLFTIVGCAGVVAGIVGIVLLINVCLQGAVVVTDKRIYGYRVSLPVDSICGILKGWFGTIIVVTAGARVAFSGLENRDKVYNEIVKLLIERQS